MKFDQIAIATPDPDLVRQVFEDLGLTTPEDEWVHDDATGHGHVWGEPVRELRGELLFNYDVAEIKEFELLTYHNDGVDWLNAASVPQPVVSHLGCHVSQETARRVVARAEELGLSVAQQLTTHHHTNPYLVERGRTYTYTIISTRRWIGFDVKLIVRHEGEGEG